METKEEINKKRKDIENDLKKVTGHLEIEPLKVIPEVFIKMDLRDYFAGQALCGLMLQEEAFIHTNRCATWAYEFADAMLKERGKK